MVGRDFGAELFGTPEPSATPTTAGRDFGAELFGAPPNVPDDLEAKLARAEARRAEFAPGEEFARGVKRAATADLPALWEQAGVMKDVGAALTVGQRLDLFNKIDSGEITSPDQLRGLDMTTGQARMYLAAPPETRSKLRDRLTKELGSRKDLIGASLETLQKYQAERRRLGARVDKLTDIENPTDFANWLASNVGAGAVNLAPIMLAAVATGGTGLLATGVGMGTAESVGNRLQALQKDLAETPQEQRADKVIQRLKETGGTDLAVGVVSGMLDTILGPAAAATKQVAKELIKRPRVEAAKKVLKETPRQMAEEFVTGGAQSLTQTAGKVATGEQEEFLTKETFIDALNDAAAEAAGAPAGTAFNAARAALAAGKTKQEAKKEADRATLLDKIAEGEDVTEPDQRAGRAGVRVAGEPDRREPAGGLDLTKPDGVVSPAKDVRRADERTRPQPAAITEDTVRQYDDLRKEALELLSIEYPTEADGRRLSLVQKDLAALVDAVVPATANQQLIQQLKNPMFDGTRYVSAMVEETPAAPATATQSVEDLTAEFMEQGLSEDEARVQAQLYLQGSESRAMQGDLFGGRRDVLDLPNRALAISGQDPVKAESYLNGLLARARELVSVHAQDSNWGRRFASKVGMTSREGFFDPAKVAELYYELQQKQVADAIEVVRSGKSRGMAGDLFRQDKPSAEVGVEKPESLEDIFGEPERAPRKKVSKTPDWDGVAITPEQRVDIYLDEESRLAKNLENNQAELQRLRDLAARPITETGPRPTVEQIKNQEKIVQSNERQLEGVRYELARAQADVAAGVTPTPVKPKAPEAPAPVQEGLFTLQEQQNLAAARKAAQERSSEERRLREEARVERERQRAEDEFLGEFSGREADEVEAAAEPAAPETPAAPEGTQAPPIDTEHVRQTPEGQEILGFFDVVQPASTSESEQEKRSYPQNAAIEALLEYDIAEPGQPTTAGIKTALNYLANRVGGMDAFRELVAALKGASPAQQSRLLTRAGLPDLTTRRGMEEFSGQVQEYFKQLPAKGEGIRIPPKSIPSKVTGTPIPYTEEFKQGVVTTTTFEPLESGKPRRPSQGMVEKEYALSDTKLRAAVRVLREMADIGGKLSAPAKAALTYMRNLNRESFADALRDLAFDLAMFELDPKHYGANSTFYGEGGRYAQDFRAWIEQNLDKNTVALLDELIADHKASAEANAKFEQAITDYNKKLDTFAETRRDKAAKNGQRAPKAPKKARHVIEETPAEEREAAPEPTIPKKNLPRVQILYEVHPAIKRALEEGDTKRALELISEAKINPYYAALAERLLETDITAKTRLIERDDMVPLDDNKNTRDTADNFISGLRDLIVTTAPEGRQPELLAQLESGKLTDLSDLLDSLNTGIPGMVEAQSQLVADARDFFNRQYGWIGKYDPVRNEIVLRKGSGGITNHAFLHEVVHAATAAQLDRPDTLEGVRKQGYDQLVELFDYAKGILGQDGFNDINTYGLANIHEFVAEAMSNPEFQAQLRVIRYKGSPYSLANRFTNSIRKLFRIQEGAESNVLDQVIFATDAMMLGGTANKETFLAAPQARALAKRAARPVPVGRPNTKPALKNMMTSRSWDEVKNNWPIFYSGLKANLRPVALGALTLRQIADLVNNRIPQVDNFIAVTEKFLSRKNRILNESGEITKRWQRLQAIDPDMSRQIGAVMHRATLQRIDPDKATLQQRNADPDLMRMWAALDPEAKQIYRDVRNFYARRYNEYKRTLRTRVIQMRQLGVSEATINEIRNEFEKGIGAGPYFPLMRFGRFWYQVGKGNDREYYMFENFGEMQAHMDARLAQDPHLEDTLKQGDQYLKGMDLHARESSFLKAAFKAVDQSNLADPQSFKDELYQAWLINQPETSFRNRFVHRTGIEGFSQDALRNFASSSFHMAYQQARFENSPEMFSQINAARMQLKDRVDQTNRANKEVMRENNELGDYVRELERRLEHIMNPEDTGLAVSMLSNVGFLWYLTSFASAATNILGGLIIGLPTLVGQQVRTNPRMSYTTAMLNSLGQMKTVAGEIVRTGFSIERGPRLRDNMVLFPSLDRSSLSRRDQAAYNRFVADGLIDITATYDQSGLASAPTESYDGIRQRAMTALSALFHNAERFNREMIAMSAFRAGMESRAGYADQQKAFAEALAEAKDVTTRSMFDYSSANRPRYMQSAPARVILQFKQFPQQMTFFLVRNLQQMLKGASPEVRREATARFVGTMGMTAIFAGTTGVWGFSTVAAIVDAVMNGLRDEEEDEEPFDFKLEYINWAVNTFGKNLGLFLTRGAGNAAGVDLHSRVSMDGMWFRDGRKNLDEEDAWRQFIVDLLGPTVGLTVSAARAVDLYNNGQTARALEAVAPGFIKQPLIATRYSQEGVTTLRGDKLVEELSPFELFMQSLGFRPADVAEIQYYNITKKAQEQEILKERQNLLDLYGLAFMSNDEKAFDKALEKIFKYNDEHPTTAIPASSLNRSIKDRMQKSSQAEHGLIVDKRLMNLLDEEYVRKLREK